jgi:hypothetical protein
MFGFRVSHHRLICTSINFLLEMYRVFQFFVLCLKVDIFTEFLVSLFYLIQFAAKQKKSEWDTWIQLVVTILMLPMLYFARTAGSTEGQGRMIAFICFQAIVIVHFILVLKQTFQPNNNWYTWIVFGRLIIYYWVYTY